MSRKCTLNAKQKILIRFFKIMIIIIIKSEIDDNPGYFLIIIKFEKSF
jgi:hypothetical protein